MGVIEAVLWGSLVLGLCVMGLTVLVMWTRFESGGEELQGLAKVVVIVVLGGLGLMGIANMLMSIAAK